MSAPAAETLNKYASLIESILQRGPAMPIPDAPPRTAFVEYGLVLPRALLGDFEGASKYSGRLAQFGSLEESEDFDVKDFDGHTRPAYLPLLIASWARALSILRERRLPADEEIFALRGGCRRLERIVHGFTFTPDAIPAAIGAEAGEAACAALALSIAAPVLGEASWPALATDFMNAIAFRERPNGALLAAGRSDNPESLWFHELVLLHALATFAVKANDRRLTDAVNRAADYHQNETEPDHATNQPWAITAFLLNPETLPMADTVLHASMAKSNGSPDGVSLMLLADCLYCIRSAARPSPAA